MDATPAPKTLSAKWRLLLSLLLAFHLVGVLLGPYSMDAPILATDLRTVWQPYMEFMFLDHGYHFFAPEPGPSHVIRYEIELADGSTLPGQFPDLNAHRPRLLYHRHFMLSEFLNAQYIDPKPPPAVAQDPQLLAEYRASQAVYKAYQKSFADHLLAETGGRKVKLFLRRHHIPTPDDIRAGRSMHDASLFEELSLGTFFAGRG